RPDGARDQESAPHRHRRLRHRLPRRRRRPLHHRGVGARAGRAGHRQRVALPQPRPFEGHTRHRHQPVRRDRGHDRRHSASEQAAPPLAITNQRGTQITREAPPVLYTRAGLEIGVAATKTFTAQTALLSLIALKLAQVRRTLPDDEIEFILEELYDLPERMEQFLDGDHPIQEIAERHFQKPFFLYLGRHIGLPVALEGALKLKEIAYIPTEAYSAGEMKHGPIALLDSETPVVCIATDQKVVYDKVVSNIQEVRARGAQVIAIATDSNEDIQHHADDVIYVPRTPAFLQAVLAVLPLQLLAYRIARLRGLNVDQPRNLAKTVTVE